MSQWGNKYKCLNPGSCNETELMIFHSSAESCSPLQSLLPLILSVPNKALLGKGTTSPFSCLLCCSLLLYELLREYPRSFHSFPSPTTWIPYMKRLFYTTLLLPTAQKSPDRNSSQRHNDKNQTWKLFSVLILSNEKTKQTKTPQTIQTTPKPPLPATEAKDTASPWPRNTSPCAQQARYRPNSNVKIHLLLYRPPWPGCVLTTGWKRKGSHFIPEIFSQLPGVASQSCCRQSLPVRWSRGDLIFDPFWLISFLPPFIDFHQNK